MGTMSHIITLDEKLELTKKLNINLKLKDPSLYVFTRHQYDDGVSLIAVNVDFERVKDLNGDMSLLGLSVYREQ